MTMTNTRPSAENAVEEKLKNMYALQKVMSRIDEIRTVRGELPLEVRDLSDEVERLAVRVTKMREEAAAARLSANKYKEERIQAQATITKIEGQLEQVSNSREYDNLTKEIEFQELEIQLREKLIRENTARENELMAAIAQNEEEKAARINDLDIKRKELDDIISENKAEEDRLREEAKQLEEIIDPRLLNAFKRIRKGSRNGLAIVALDRDSCGGCFAKIPPQRRLDVAFHKKVIVCEYCGRILIDPELAGIKVEKPVEEKKNRRRRVARKEEE
ncbi:MAG: C4-type zinc ribbon domain-containing protein [Bacteroidaceae bacterium]|nr:C4-type zinc ribbon domain-containing protein [Bacteroidaceae bacterium]